MPLERYNEKRDFKVTPEPPGKVVRNTGALRYVIQKHAASRLHYDFRLELGGVLLSWAIPKGPSLNPGDRRLAVHVEDHPVEYGGFEGIIPHGEYGGGSVVVWDRGNWFPEGDAEADYKRGHLKFRLEGEKLHGGFSLVRMHGRGEADNWLLLKQDDEHVDEDGERLVRDRPESVISQRTVEEVAADPDKMWRSNRGGHKGGVHTLSPSERQANARKPRTRPAPSEDTSAGLSDEDIARKRMGLPPLAPAARKKATSKADSKSTSKSAAKSAGKTASRSTSKAAAKATDKTASKAAGKSATRSARETASKATGKAASKSTSKAAAKTTGKTASKSTSKAAAKTTGKTASKSTSKAAAKTTGKTASKSTSKATKAAGKIASKSTSKATKAAGKTASKSTSKATKAAGKAASKSTSKTASTRAKPAPRARTKTAAKKSSTAADEPGPAVRAAARSPRAPSRGEAHLPSQISPELATLVDDVPTGAEWLHEIKYDGYRLVARLDGDDVRLLTRRGEDWSARFPWLSEALRARISAPTAIVDGELVHLGADGVTRFGELQRALSEERHAALVYFAFDLLHLDGVDLRPLPLEQRKEALAGLLPVERKPGRVRLSEHILGLGDPLFKRACRLGLEGVISKRRDAPYRSGRYRDWLKIKCSKRQELVVGGFTPARSGTREIGSLLLGVYDDAGKLVYSGKVGSGFDFQGAAHLRARLEQLRTRENPFSKVPPGFGRSTFVRPEIVVEVGFTDWTSDGRLRHPVFEGLREDKRAKDVHREKVVPVEDAEDAAPSKPGKKSAQKPARAPAEPPASLRKAPAEPPAEPASRLRKAAPKPPARPRGGSSVEVLGVKISHPDRVLYPADGITKRDIAEYYEKTAEWVLPWLVGRPISVVRCPDTIDKPCFFQKHIHHELPPGVRTADLDGEGGDAPFLYIESAQGLVGMTQVGTLELHIWGSTAARPEDPDRIIIDLDPDTAVPWARVKETALAVRSRLEDLGLVSFLKTTGGKGLHVVVPLTPGKQDWDQVKGFARGIALEFARAAPDMFTATATKARRDGKIYMDYLRNYRGSTSVAPYSTRARPGAPVSVPLRWDELAALETSQKYTVQNLAARLSALRSDPWKDLLKTKQFLRAEVLREVVRNNRG